MSTLTGQSAYAFNQSIGMNLHLDRTDGQWQNRPFIRALLKALNIHWVRSSLNILPGPGNAYADFLQQLDNNDKADAIRSIQFVAKGTNAAQIQALTSFWGACFLEGPNELDISGNANWAADDIAEMSQIAIANRHWNDGLGVVAPSVSAADPALVASGLYTCANMHDYFGSRPPETTGWGGDVYNNGTVYGSEAYNIATARRAAPGKPVFSTESGYATVPGGLTEYTQAVYLERLLLVGAMNGVAKRFLYDLCDDNQHFGLVHLDGTPKLALKALIGFINLLSDSVPPPSGTQTTIDVEIVSSVPICAYPVFKNDGSTLLVLWQPAQIQDPDTYSVTLPQAAVVSLGGSISGATRVYSQSDHFDWFESDTPNLQALSIDERPLIIALNAGASVALPLIPSP